jgi:6-phosphogluconolactonase
MDERRVDDVPAAFAALLEEVRPRSIALSGGSTARQCYETAAALEYDWSGTTFWFGDERCVPITDPDSNERMARAAWLDQASSAAIESMVNAGPTPEAGAVAYDARLRAAGGVDLMHLGLGPDGHTASLFPGSSALDETDRWVVPSGDDLHPHPRLTVTYPAITASRLVVVTVAGVEKRDALARVRSGDRRAPAARIAAAEVIWLVDHEAAG